MRRLLLLVGFLAAAALSAADKLYIANSAGTDVTIADVATNKVLKTLKVGPNPHGIAVPAKADFILVTIEGGKQGQLVWIDPRTDEVVDRMPIGKGPNQLAVTPDGKLAYVPVADGHYEVVDLAGKKIIERIKTGGRPHNTLGSHDGKLMILAPLGGSKKAFIVDTGSHKIVGEIPFSNSIRPIALARDGRLFAQVDGLVGFEVGSVPERKFLQRVPAELTPEQKKTASRSHGLEIRPDQKEVWECDVEHGVVHAFDITGPAPKQVAAIPVGGPVYWITFAPDGRFAYASLRTRHEIAVIDATKRAVVARIPTGKEPKRLIVVSVP